MARTVVYGFGLVAALMLGCLHAPVLWSPDGRWVAYTIAVRPSAPELAPGWLYPDDAGPAPGVGVGAAGASRGGDRRIEIWATRPESGESILLEESRGPLTSPAWSPDGKALAFGRLVPEEEGRARFEIVLQEAPDRQRILVVPPLSGRSRQGGGPARPGARLEPRWPLSGRPLPSSKTWAWRSSARRMVGC